MKLYASAAWAVVKAHDGVRTGPSRRLLAAVSALTAVAAMAVGTWAAAPALSAPPLRHSASTVARSATPNPVRVTLVSSGSNSLCINPVGITWGDGTSPPSTLATDFSNANGNCDPPASLSHQNTAIAQNGACLDYASPLSGTAWVSIDPQGNCSDTANSPGTYPGPYTHKFYIYDTEFVLPACGTNMSISGSMMADNAAAAYLNQNPIGNQSNLDGGTSPNFNLPPTPFSSSNQAYFELGTTNYLDFLVQDSTPSETGLDFSVALTYTPCPATLKICKVAGFGVRVGRSVTFNIAPAPSSGDSRVSVPAGPAPGGNCVVAGTYPQGTEVTVTESIPTGESVSGIEVEPPAAVDSTSSGTGTAKVSVGTGATEVTYTDVNSAAENNSGYLEICKQAVISPAWSRIESPNGINFQFTVGPQVAGGVGILSQTVDVLSGSCSAPIQVLVGPVQVSETTGPDWNMVGCAGTNPGTLTACNLAASDAVVNVEGGGVTDEAILTFTNSGYVPPVHGVTGCTNCDASLKAAITAGNSDIGTGTVIGNASHGTPAGTMRFYACGPTAKPRACTSKANPVGSRVKLIPGTDHTATGTSARFWPNAPGYWCFAEYYSGDHSYRASSDTSTDGCFHVISTALTVTTVALPYAQVGLPYSADLTATGGAIPYRWTAAGLPEGLTLNPATGVLSGRSAVAGVYSPVVTVQDSAKPAHTTTATFGFLVASAPAITSPSGATFTIGVARKFSVTANGVPTPSLTEKGALPAGVRFIDNGNGTAILIGAPKVGAGKSFRITITASNSVGANATQHFTLKIARKA